MNKASQDKPLSGMRVIEMGQLIAGPFTGSVLGYFGAEVINCLLYTSPSPRD